MFPFKKRYLIDKRTIRPIKELLNKDSTLSSKFYHQIFNPENKLKECPPTINSTKTSKRPYGTSQFTVTLGRNIPLILSAVPIIYVVRFDLTLRHFILGFSIYFEPIRSFPHTHFSSSKYESLNVIYRERVSLNDFRPMTFGDLIGKSLTLTLFIPYKRCMCTLSLRTIKYNTFYYVIMQNQLVNTRNNVSSLRLLYIFQ